MVNLARASFIGAGHVPLGWTPDEKVPRQEESFDALLQWCEPCSEQKAASYRLEDDCDWEKFVYPYDLGWKRNFYEVLSSWSGETRGNGVWWPVRKGCDQFTLSSIVGVLEGVKLHVNLLLMRP
ncbi:hypothetical protein ANCDUO_06802 [Ancylostoma duodenale]|uniref:Uncharacterized protein n=1 Tax=Ancylostoma duodenale TaxID=51022 RepID=A0A0C2D0Q7_9BILA|nr:hypothetical protein ANCDUO_06802 [Ancylostoma duodenale]